MSDDLLDNKKYAAYVAARVLVEAAQDDNVVDLVADYIYRVATEEEALRTRVGIAESNAEGYLRKLDKLQAVVEAAKNVNASWRFQTEPGLGYMRFNDIESVLVNLRNDLEALEEQNDV